MAQRHRRGHGGGRIGRAIDKKAGTAGQGRGGVYIVRNLVAPGVGYRKHRVGPVDRDVRGEQLAVRKGNQGAPYKDGQRRAAGIGCKGGGGGDVGTGGAGCTSRARRAGNTCCAGGPSGPGSPRNTCRAGGSRNAGRSGRAGGPGGSRGPGGYNHIYATYQTALPPIT